MFKYETNYAYNENKRQVNNHRWTITLYCLLWNNKYSFDSYHTPSTPTYLQFNFRKILPRLAIEYLARTAAFAENYRSFESLQSSHTPTLSLADILYTWYTPARVIDNNRAAVAYLDTYSRRICLYCTLGLSPSNIYHGQSARFTHARETKIISDQMKKRYVVRYV